MIAEKSEKKIKEQEKASGIAPPELSELEQELEEVIYRMKEAQHEVDANDSKISDDKRKAEDIRQKALETFAQTKKRKSLGLDDDETLTSSKRSQSAGTDTLIYLREKSKNDQRLKEEELELKKRKQELLEAQQKAQIDQQKDFMNTVRESMRQQQQQTQQMMVLMAQMLNTLKKDLVNYVERKDFCSRVLTNILLSKLSYCRHTIDNFFICIFYLFTILQCNVMSSIYLLWSRKT